MGDHDEHDRRDQLVERVRRKAHNKLEAQKNERSVWFGFGMFGLVGWAVAIPTLAGLALGWWIDHRFETEISWTLALMLAGVVLGCFNAWWWVSEESRRDDKEEQDHG